MQGENLSPRQREVLEMARRIYDDIKYEFWRLGLYQGEVRSARDNLRAVLEERFGELPPEVIERIEARPEPDQLALLLRRALDVAALDELNLLEPDTLREIPLERGRQEGELTNCREALYAVLHTRFGALPSKLGKRIQESGDVERLKVAIRQAVRINSLEELSL
jgi:hypothetical protein